MRFLLAVLAALVLADCTQRTSPIAPPSNPNPSTPVDLAPYRPRLTPTPVPNTTSATLEIRNFRVSETRSTNSFVYFAEFDLAETSGRSGATVDALRLWLPTGAHAESGVECWRRPIRVPAGGTFAVDDAFLGYCSPDPESVTAVFEVKLEVVFRDDAGAVGEAELIADIAPAR